MSRHLGARDAKARRLRRREARQVENTENLRKHARVGHIDEPPPETSGGEDAGSRSFFTTLPGILTALATLLATFTGLLTALHRFGVIGGDDSASTTAIDTAETSPSPPIPPPAAEFSDPPGIFTEATVGDADRYFSNGFLYFKIATANAPMVAIARADTPRDLRVQVEAQKVEGSENFGLGVICRHQNRRNYYSLGIGSGGRLGSGGRYNIVKYVAGSPRSLTGGWKVSPVINGGNSANAVKVECTGGARVELTLYVNDRLVAQRVDARGLANGGVGLRAGTADSPVTIRFSRFSFRQIN